MSDDYEISRLKTPLSFDDYKAYDSKGDRVNCVDLINQINFYIEPDGDLTDSEILQYAPKSKAASKIRLDHGFGDLHDILNLNPSIPWILGLYYVLLIYIIIPYVCKGNRLYMFIALILSVIPLFYLYYKFNLNKYISKYLKAIENEDGSEDESKSKDSVEFSSNNESKITNKALREYKNEFKDLKKSYEDKEKILKKIIKKRFEPPQLTYDRFMGSVDNCHKVFYNELGNAYSIIELNKDTSRVKESLDNKIKSLKLIIKQIDDLSDELIITFGSDESNDEIESLLEDIENLIDSIKEYK